MEISSNLIIVDSSGLISLVVESDSNHGKAVAISNGFVGTNGKALIPAEVFAETLNSLGKKFGHEYAAGTVQAVLESAAFAVVPSSDVSRLDAVDQFRTAPAGVSLTDCLVMTVADEYGTKDIFGFDKQFEDAGYERLTPADEGKEAA
jgi:predicted nucleic acid-binding protein